MATRYARDVAHGRRALAAGLSACAALAASPTLATADFTDRHAPPEATASGRTTGASPPASSPGSGQSPPGSPDARDARVAENASHETPASAPPSEPGPRGLEPLISANAPTPPPVKTDYLNIGIAFAAEVPTGGDFCTEPALCILGPGGGVVVRGGRRVRGEWYLGAAYEISKQDPAKLFRLATLQQLRFEARRYFATGREWVPYASGGAGLVGYGNELRIATWGPALSVGVGLETQIANGPLLGFSVSYRPAYFVDRLSAGGRSWEPGLTHIFSLELAIEGTERL